MFCAEASRRVVAACIPDVEIDDMGEMDIGAAPGTRSPALWGEDAKPALPRWREFESLPAPGVAGTIYLHFRESLDGGSS